jgi:uncharacterized protein
MNKKRILKAVEKHVRDLLDGEGTGHDWWHIDRVRTMALRIAKDEKADLFVVELAALLHDIADHKFHGGDHTIGPKKAREFLLSHNVEAPVTDHVVYIIEHQSYSASLGTKVKKTKEFKSVQDADRLDVLGAIGIARAFAYGGKKGRPIYDPANPYRISLSKKKYLSVAASSSMNHFYEKLLKVRRLMNTPMGKRIAVRREKYLKGYMKQFFNEWHSKD